MSEKLIKAGLALGLAPASYWLVQNWQVTLSWLSIGLLLNLRRGRILKAF